MTLRKSEVAPFACQGSVVFWFMRASYPWF